MIQPNGDAIVDRGRIIEAVLVSVPDCHLCHDAAELLGSMSQSHPVHVIEVDGHSSEGRSLLSRFRAPFLPLLLIDGEYFGHGRISRRKLAGHLASLAGAAGTAPTRKM